VSGDEKIIKSAEALAVRDTKIPGFYFIPNHQQ